MGATDTRLCDVVQLLFRWTEQTLVVALTVCGKTHSGLCSRHGYRFETTSAMQDAQKGLRFHPPTPARQDAPFHSQGRSERRGES